MAATPTPLLLLALPFLFAALAAAQPRPFGGAPPGYARYVTDATATGVEEEYDYIVVGGGAAGCPLAATLAGPGGGRVLLLERGGAPAEFPALATAGGFVRTLALADPSPDSDAPAQAFSSEDGVPNVRARVLGGGTAINAGFYSRAHPGWFHGHGEDAEVPDWDMRLVNSSYEWVEQELTFQPEVHGWQAAVRAALLEANVTPWNGFTVEHVTGTKIGATTFDASGRRHSAADLLAFARPGRLHVAVRAAVTRVIINPIDPGHDQRWQRLASCTRTVFSSSTMPCCVQVGRSYFLQVHLEVHSCCFSVALVLLATLHPSASLFLLIPLTLGSTCSTTLATASPSSHQSPSTTPSSRWSASLLPTALPPTSRLHHTSSPFLPCCAPPALLSARLHHSMSPWQPSWRRSLARYPRARSGYHHLIPWRPPRCASTTSAAPRTWHSVSSACAAWHRCSRAGRWTYSVRPQERRARAGEGVLGGTSGSLGRPCHSIGAQTTLLWQISAGGPWPRCGITMEGVWLEGWLTRISGSWARSLFAWWMGRRSA
ncbi:uncharacterized protein [Triticum aestivum]|uniref:uncharacterized protein isoform X2 n=1 Tax=Triticum aestivum TaxID=4565 RepID=UPI001D005CA8|nr:uncharacterized protein LOC123160447 isoform X2 [Triticum aestivum]